MGTLTLKLTAEQKKVIEHVRQTSNELPLKDTLPPSKIPYSHWFAEFKKSQNEKQQLEQALSDSVNFNNGMTM